MNKRIAFKWLRRAPGRKAPWWAGLDCRPRPNIVAVPPKYEARLRARDDRRIAKQDAAFQRAANRIVTTGAVSTTSNTQCFECGIDYWIEGRNSLPITFTGPRGCDFCRGAVPKTPNPYRATPGVLP